jgi:hypothetical protein
LVIARKGCPQTVFRYVIPIDKLNGRDHEIFKERDKNLKEARKLRKQKRQKSSPEIMSIGEDDIPLNQAV